MADYRYNFDRRGCVNGYGLSYNQVIDIVFNEDSFAPVEPVTLAEAKNFCKIDISEDDTLISEIITAARQHVEEMTNIGFIERSITAVLNNGNGGAYLPYGPIGDVQEIDSIAPTTGQIEGVKWKQLTDRKERVTVTYTGGYATLPFKLKLGLLQCIFYMYDIRVQRENPYGPVYIDTLKSSSRNV